MKNRIILLLVFAGLSASCDIQMDNLFDQSANARIEAFVEQTYQTLIAASNGWIMEYYPQENQNYGGVNILMRFDANDGVEMLNETADDLDAVEKSTYTINRSSGAVLAFDTYNSYITYYADPGVALGEGRSKGFMGDLEFAVKSISDSEIVLKGTKTQNTILMRAMPAGVTWQEYLDEVQSLKKTIYRSFFTRFEAAIGDRTEELKIDPTYPRLTFTYEDDGGINRTVVLSYMYTDTGIKLYEPLEVFGETMQNFVWDEDTLSFVCTDPGADVRLTGKRSNYFRPYDFYLGEWKLHSYADASGTVNPVLTVTITQHEEDKSLILSGITHTNASYGIFDYPILMNWSTDGRISIIGQQVGTKTFTFSGALQENLPVYLYTCNTAGSFYRAATYPTAGMISKTTLIEDRVDFESNGVISGAAGFLYYMHPVHNGTTYNASCGTRWVSPIYLARE